jgi:hypothetical protein
MGFPMMQRSENDSQKAQDVEVDTQAVGDARAAVRKMLEDLAPCETGYPGVTACGNCPGCRDCADALADALAREFPSMEWAPAIRDVLGIW